MTPEQFAYWLQGFKEVGGERPLVEQWRIIKDHLATVFNKVTPNYQVPYNPQNPPYYVGDDPNQPRIIC